MSEHDPLCRAGQEMAVLCECAHIRKVRADERERIAADAEDFIKQTYPQGPRSEGVILHKWVAVEEIVVRITRNGGRDE